MTEPTHQEIASELAEVKALLEALTSEVKAMREVVQAWSTAKNAGRFIVWIGKLLVGIGAIVIVAKSGFVALFGGTN